MTVDCVLRMLAPAYSLGALDSDDLARFESHLVDGCAACERELTDSERIAAFLATSAPVVAPPPSLRSRLLAKVGAPSEALPASWSKFLSEGDWQPHQLPGMQHRVLHVDEKRREITMIVRANAGAKYPSHRHASFEHLLMLQGELLIGETNYGPGAFISSTPDSIHPPSLTATGCMFLLRTSLDDQVLEGRELRTHPGVGQQNS
jgi:putative transcriptional regulator